MDFIFRPLNRNNPEELHFIGEMDSRIPFEFDSHYVWNERSIEGRIKSYSTLDETDFMEVVVLDKEIVAFHIVKKIPYPPDSHIASVITLWVKPEFRKQGLAYKLKSHGEVWAKKMGLPFIQTNVHKNNKTMLDLNEQNGFETTYLHMRKYLK